MAMPWGRAKAKEAAILADETGEMRANLTRLFDACFRIQREACEAAGHHIPMIVENVKGAQKFVGRARWSFGSYFLWGDIPALMPIQKYHQRLKVKAGEQWNINRPNFTGTRGWDDAIKVPSQSGGRTDPGNGARFTSRDCGIDRGIKNGRDWFGSGENCSLQRRASSGSSARKAASAMIAKIPLTLSTHIARTFKP